MSTMQTLNLGGKKFVVMPQAEYRRLTKGKAGAAPRMPALSADGTYPAVQAMRVMPIGESRST